jgi:hypothetical protein
MQIELDITDVVPAIHVPTLVVSKEFLREDGDAIATAIPNSEFLVVPGQGGAIHENEYPIEAIEAFLAGAPQRRIPDTVLATVLFIGSGRLDRTGGGAWRPRLARAARAAPRGRPP